MLFEIGSKTHETDFTTICFQWHREALFPILHKGNEIKEVSVEPTDSYFTYVLWILRIVLDVYVALSKYLKKYIIHKVVFRSMDMLLFGTRSDFWYRFPLLSHIEFG